jgi:DNA (cytosine-5)-methyltransferase 1
MMTFGSVCSGIEAASVAWHGMGWRAAWLAEIEPFPSAVLAHHYPDVPNLGDMTTIADKVLSGDVAAPDVLVGGTPCQAFSIAGLRQSLDDDRGQLSLEFVRLANAIDSARSAAGKQPAIIVWENVPGVLNTKDNAFGCFLAGLAGESSALQPAGGKWTNAGCVFGPQRAVAWRVLDAQFFGVPQRRRRVFVVASARDAFDPSQILFEFDGVRRDTAPSRKTGQETAENAGCGVKAASYSTMNDPVLTLCASDHKGVGNQTFCDGKIIAQQVSFNRQRSDEYSDQDIASTCTARDYKDATDLVVAYSFDSLASNSMKSANPHSGCREVDLSKTLDTSHPCPSKNQGGIGIVQSYAIAGNIIGRDLKHGGNGLGCHHEVCYTLTKADQHGVAVCFQQNSRDEVRLLGGDGQVVGALVADAGAKQQNYICESSDCLNPDQPQCWRVYHPDGVAPALQSGEGRGNAVLDTVAAFKGGQGALAGNTIGRQPHNGGNGNGFDASGVCYTLTATDRHGVAIITIASKQQAMTCEDNLASTLGANDYKEPQAVLSGKVRCLMPVECERLQGFPDHYTRIPQRKKTAEDCPDSPRYKALGNSMAVPCMAWIGKRIADYVGVQP